LGLVVALTGGVGVTRNKKKVKEGIEVEVFIE